MINFVSETYEEYQKDFNILLPKLQEIKIDKNLRGSFGRFMVDDLYNEIYILYICDDFYKLDTKMKKQILYHEFTHLTDSLSFLSQTKEEFTDIMCSYSEFHASQIEFTKRIIDNNTNILITMQSEIFYATKSTIKEFLDLSFALMCQDLHKMSSKSENANMFFNTNSIYYFFGYVKALHRFDLNYKLDYSLIPISFVTHIQKIEEILLQKDIDVNIVNSSYVELVEHIKSEYKIKLIKKLLSK